MDASLIAEMKDLAEQNWRLKKIYAEISLRNDLLKEALAPSQDWDVPDAFATLQRRLEAWQGKAGKREYAQVLRLLERFEQNVLHNAVRDALQMRAISFDAARHQVLCRMAQRAFRLDLDLYPFLPRTNITTTSATTYMSLLTRDAP